MRWPMSFAEALSETLIKPVALTALPAAMLIGGVRQGLIPLADDEPRYPIDGRLVVDGRPTAGVEVRLHAFPVEGLAPTPMAVTRADGNFSVRTNAWQAGVAAGEYRVTVTFCPHVASSEEYVPGANQLRRRYARAATTPLRVTVRPGANQLGTWDIPSCECRQ